MHALARWKDRHFHDRISSMQAAFTELGAGVVRVEKADPPFDEIILTIAEDADCSGLPDLDYDSAATTNGSSKAFGGLYRPKVLRPGDRLLDDGRQGLPLPRKGDKGLRAQI